MISALSAILLEIAVTLGAAVCFRRAALRLHAAADQVVCIACHALGANPAWDGTFSTEQGATWRREVRPRLRTALACALVGAGILLVPRATAWAVAAVVGLVTLWFVFLRAATTPIARFRADMRNGCPCRRCTRERQELRDAR
jgi:hypothetical protein